MKGIVLLSGGLDSTLALIKLLKEGHEVVPMFVDYNQWSLEGEFNSVRRVVSWIEQNPLEVDNWLKKGLKTNRSTQLLHQTIKVPVGLVTFDGRVGSAWGRSIALVGLAAMWAYIHGDDCEFIALGLHQGDVGPDCKPGDFDISLHQTLSAATKGKIGLLLPIRELTVEDIGKALAEPGIPWNLMYSCYWYPPCGYKSVNEEYRCPGCRRKVIAMKAGGITDGLLLELPNCKEITYQSPLAEKTNY